MLPSPSELRELSKRMLAAVSYARTDEMKQSLAEHAFLLAQVAEASERDNGVDSFVRRSNIEHYARLLARALDERTRRTVEALLAQDCGAREKERRKIEAWRRRAEELLATAEQFGVPSAQETLRRAAANFTQMADHAEARLKGMSALSEKAK
jgi:hypothetical protein